MLILNKLGISLESYEFKSLNEKFENNFSKTTANSYNFEVLPY